MRPCAPWLAPPALACLLAITLLLAGCGATTDQAGSARPASAPANASAGGMLLAGETMALAYSGYRAGQQPDLGQGAVYPSREEVLEDLRLLVAHGFRLIRLYDAGPKALMTLELIREHQLPLLVLQGIWLSAELSNHDGCPWLDEPMPADLLAANVIRNEAETRQGIALARQFPELIIAVNVGNEALVEWTDHLVPLEQVIRYVRQVRAAIEQPVTVAENYLWWINEGAPLAAEVDFLGVHTYALWEGKTIDEGLAFTIENIEEVQAALPGKPVAILEAGWATLAEEFGDRAGEREQARYFQELAAWAGGAGMTVFFFSAFDEPWKGDPARPLGAEKHWGVFNLDRSPKYVLQQAGSAGAR
jgi:exo-beta-1,3-glucanase (GH17 family)